MIIMKKNGVNDAIKDTIYQFNAPLIFNFTCFILKKAAERGIDRIYFLSRDGYEPFQYAKKLNADLGLGLDLRYLYASRLAWRLPAYSVLPKEKIIESVFAPSFFMTPFLIFERIMATDEEKRELIGQLKEFDMYETLNGMRLKEFREKLADNPLFWNILNQNAAAALEKTLAYFEQEGLTEKDFAICDSGWSGTMQRCLQVILDSTGRKIHITGFYFGLYMKPQEEPFDYCAFYFSPNRYFFRKLKFNNNLLESLLVSPDPMTAGYHKERGKYMPVFKTGAAPYFDEDHACLHEWAESKRAQNLYFLPEKQRINKISRKIRRVMFCPRKEQLQCFERYSFSDDPAEKDKHSLVKVLTKKEARNLLFFNRALRKLSRKKTENETRVYWSYGSIAASQLKFKLWYRMNIYLWEMLRALKNKLKQ